MAEELKAAGNTLFASHDYRGAAAKYSEAIAVDSHNAVLYSNRAACYHALAQYENGLSDAQKATEIDPTYSKGWYRRAACEDGLGNYPESIESYQTAITTASVPSQKAQCKTALESVQAKIMNPNTMSIDVMKALARAHDIRLPVSLNRDVVYRALSTHRLFGTEPKIRLLLIPQSQTAPLTKYELAREPGVDVTKKIAALLKCRLTDSVVLHSEDQIAYAKGNSTGVGIGRLHTSYEAWMDDNAVAGRPLNQRACRLLHRPNTHGPILVMKTTFIKSDDSVFGKSEDILCFERVDEEELLSDDFKKLRAEWVQFKGTGDAPLVIQLG
ncbi:hypothetical protein C8R44DRAFT_245671 [Mycena epipterygia]|nr:hypothetical protein C8R44DRAFT_245671 [Mycena epipterygia]